MRIEFDPHEIEPLVRHVVDQCLERQRAKHAAEKGNVAYSDNNHEGSNSGQLLLTAAEAAKVLGISERTLWELKRNGKISFVRIGNGEKKDGIRYSVDDLKSFIEARRSSARRPTV